MLSQSAPEASNKVGALKGMLEVIRTKAEITGVLGPQSLTPAVIEDALDSEVFKILTLEENEIVMHATQLFLKKKQDLAAQAPRRLTL